MSKSNALFQQRFATDPRFRREAELAELRQLDPEWPECEEDDGPERPGREDAESTLCDQLF
ncbi:hypothetical protein ACW73L_19485 [Methylolobus aquaticus]